MTRQDPSPADEEARTSLSRLGLGAWAFGGVGWGTQDDSDSIAAIHRAVELGVNWIDTAPVYGNGHAEDVVGSALAALDVGERPRVFTKAGVLIDPVSGRTYRDLTPQSLRTECEASLARLKLDCIDLYQLHWPTDDPGGIEQAWETLGELQREGKVRWTGVSNFSVPLLDRSSARRSIDAVQTPLSLLTRDSVNDVLPWAARRKVHALVYSPLESGLLSGRFSAHRLRSLPQTDWRRRRKQFQEPQFSRTLALLVHLELIGTGLGISLAELAIAWTLIWPDVDGVIVGARSAAQVDGWFGAAGLTLDDCTLDAIATALVQTSAGEGPTRPPSLS